MIYNSLASVLRAEVVLRMGMRGEEGGGGEGQEQEQDQEQEQEEGGGGWR